MAVEPKCPRSYPVDTAVCRRIQIERDEDPSLSLARCEYGRVWLTAEPLFQGTFHIMTRVSEECECVAGQVLV
jgi:hypothetical protein